MGSEESGKQNLVQACNKCEVGRGAAVLLEGGWPLPKREMQLTRLRTTSLQKNDKVKEPLILTVGREGEKAKVFGIKCTDEWDGEEPGGGGEDIEFYQGK